MQCVERQLRDCLHAQLFSLTHGRRHVAMRCLVYHLVVTAVAVACVRGEAGVHPSTTAEARDRAHCGSALRDRAVAQGVVRLAAACVGVDVPTARTRPRTVVLPSQCVQARDHELEAMGAHAHRRMYGATPCC